MIRSILLGFLATSLLTNALPLPSPAGVTRPSFGTAPYRLYSVAPDAAVDDDDDDDKVYLIGHDGALPDILEASRVYRSQDKRQAFHDLGFGDRDGVLKTGILAGTDDEKGNQAKKEEKKKAAAAAAAPATPAAPAAVAPAPAPAPQPITIKNEVDVDVSIEQERFQHDKLEKHGKRWEADVWQWEWLL